MLRDWLLAFDAEIVGAGPFYSPAQMNRRLGKYDATALFIVVHDYSPSGSSLVITAALDHSGDSQNWIMKTITYDSITGNPTTTIATWDSSTSPTAAWGGDDGHLPKLPYARLNLTTSGTFTSARVKVYVAQRDKGARQNEQTGAA